MLAFLKFIFQTLCKPNHNASEKSQIGSDEYCYMKWLSKIMAIKYTNNNNYYNAKYCVTHLLTDEENETEKKTQPTPADAYTPCKWPSVFTQAPPLTNKYNYTMCAVCAVSIAFNCTIYPIPIPHFKNRQSEKK